MKKITSEFGTFTLSYDSEGGPFILFLDDIPIGYFKPPYDPMDIYNNVETTKVRFDIAIKVVQAYLSIMRFESKLGMFIKIPLNNSFKDAFLRMQIESLGQTLEVRKFIEEYDANHDWIVYPKTAEFYALNEHFDTCDMCFITPYGRYEFYQLSDEEYRVFRTREGSTYVLSDITVPYASRGYPEFNLKHTAMLQAGNVIKSDTEDTIHRKSIEVGKRTAEAIKYMFNYDKLRRALRNRGTQ